MHEYSLACSIAEICQESAQANRLVVIHRVTMAVGPLAAVSFDTLAFLFGEVASQHGLGRLELVFSRKPLIVKCNACGVETTLETPQEGFCEPWHNPEGAQIPWECPSCGSRDVEHPDASLFAVESLEGEQEDAAGG